jgi:hypothetical protein
VSTFAFPPETVNQLKTDLKTKGCYVDAKALAEHFEPNVAAFLVIQGYEHASYRIPRKVLMGFNNARTEELLRELQEDPHSTKEIGQKLESLASRTDALARGLEDFPALGRFAIEAEAGCDIGALSEWLRELAQHVSGARASLPGVGRARSAPVSRCFLILQLAGHFEDLGGRPATTKDGAFHAAAEILLHAVPGLEGRSFHHDILKSLKALRVRK